MTYCLAIAVDQGLVFVSDSRTNAGVDQVSTYSKMHTFSRDGDRQLVLLSAGNLATSQGVIQTLRRDIETDQAVNLMTVDRMYDAAEYVGGLARVEGEKHGPAVAAAGFSADSTFILGGQIGDRPARLYLIYPQGNHIMASRESPFLQIGETKYGKPVLDRVVHATTSLDDAALCGLVSMDSTIRSNASVGPPVEVLSYAAGSLRIKNYLNLGDDDPYFLEFRRAWNESIQQAYDSLPRFQWDDAGPKLAQE